uniref:Uncharacterized protein n=1 Tax=viral metagenome TaxID=1070528 RepID=A0A6M3MCD2_9ZZZZ
MQKHIVVYEGLLEQNEDGDLKINDSDVIFDILRFFIGENIRLTIEEIKEVKKYFCYF